MNDYYQTLEIELNASQDQINSQYRFLVQAWHPDKFGSSESKAKAEEKLKQINEAYSVLKTPIKREQYDRQRHQNNYQYHPQGEYKRQREQAETQRREQESKVKAETERRRKEQAEKEKREQEARTRAEAEKQQKFKVRDFRQKTEMLKRIKRSTLIWAEGEDIKNGEHRFQLYRSDKFAIWTTPISSIELQKALEIVKPKEIYVFAVSPTKTDAESFLYRLTNICKYVITQFNGRTTIRTLAAGMPSSENAVQAGLQLLGASGHLTVGIEEDVVSLLVEDKEKNPYLQKELFIALKGMLNEISAYREYFATASLNELLNL